MPALVAPIGTAPWAGTDACFARPRDHPPLHPGPTPAAQMEAGLARLAARAAKKGRQPPHVLAYFQAHSSTHAPAPELARMLAGVRQIAQVAGLIVSTRPDCLDEPRWEVLSHQAKSGLFWLELGLQSAHDSTLAALNRGHDVACFDRAIKEAQARDIRVVAHVILGLPGETQEHTDRTARHLARLGVWGVKMHNLMVLEHTQLARDWTHGSFTPWTRPQWVAAAASFLARLPAATLIHRLVADPGRETLLSPDWVAQKDLNLSALAEYLERQHLRQGSACHLK